MNDALAHYDALLGGLYSWMLGDIADRIESQAVWLRTVVGDAPSRGLRAIDLGAGSGAESLALARLGYDVVAVEANAALATEIRSRVVAEGAAARIQVIQDDLVAQLERDDSAAVVVCLGDTLTHLASEVAVQRLLRAARERIDRGGRLVLSWRDLTPELRGTDRFLLVRSDTDRILTCFLEYAGERVLVHDVVHERAGTKWSMRKSSYPKLRLALGHVRAWLADAGFAVVEPVPCPGGLLAVVAR